MFLGGRRRVITHALALALRPACWRYRLRHGRAGHGFRRHVRARLMADVSSGDPAGQRTLVLYARPYLPDRGLSPAKCRADPVRHRRHDAAGVGGQHGDWSISAWSCWRCARTRWSRWTATTAIHRGGYEVLRARFAGLGHAALRHVAGVRRHRHLGSRRRSSRVRPGPDTTHAAVPAWFPRRGSGVQVRRRAFPHVVPDVYQGAPTADHLVHRPAPKLAAFGMAYRLLESGVGPMSRQWH